MQPGRTVCLLRRVLLVVGLFAMLPALGARAGETIAVGIVGSVPSIYWPLYIGIDKGMFAAEGVNPDIISLPSASANMQQLVGRSLNIASTSIVDPIRAVEKGAPVALLRIEGAVAPFSLLSKPSITRMEDLKGKIISLGGLTDITRIYVERMLAAHGIKRGEFDMIYAGQSGARLAALQSGAADAALLASPVDAIAEAAGFRNLGLVLDYVKDLPFSAYSVGVRWAADNKTTLQKFLAAYQKGTNWFYDDANREEAIRIMSSLSGGQTGNVSNTYAFFRKIQFFERSSKVSEANLKDLIEVLRSLGVVESAMDPNTLILPEGTL
jgi:ABC-type nitrate/sulfonate/bicarbonate transport system substrate-binding protein